MEPLLHWQATANATQPRHGTMEHPIPWLEPSDPLPPPHKAWGPESEAPGLLAAGGLLDVTHLEKAYAQGTFPWFSNGQPILWWAPDPRMVLQVANFKLHPSLRKTLRKFANSPNCAIRIDSDFSAVIHACATVRRAGQNGTWIVPAMISAYEQLHAAGKAHSIETWIDGKLTGGLYCVALGKAVFGESMFAHATDTSKIALAALVCLARQHGIPWIDCQQNTRHLASLGANELCRTSFLDAVRLQQQEPEVEWKFDSVYWSQLLHN
jgi:leucyl/phenylalanyl-tRNA--protein transferase